MLEEIGKFMNRHPILTLVIVSIVGDTITKTSYIRKTGKMPSDFTFRFDTKPMDHTDEERDKHGF